MSHPQHTTGGTFIVPHAFTLTPPNQKLPTALLLNEEAGCKREGPVGSHGKWEIQEMASTERHFINFYCTCYSTHTVYIHVHPPHANAIETGRAGNEYMYE